MSEEVRIGVIGIGYWGKKVLEEYYELSKENPNIKLVAVCDPLEQNLIYAKEKFAVPNIFNDFKEMLKFNNLDAVHIATPNDTHFEIAKFALENNKHVLVEKPMTKSSEEAYKLLEIGTRQKKVIQVGHIFRFNNAVNELKRLIQNGVLGKIFVGKLEWTDKYIPKTETNILFDLLPHPFDILNHIFNEWPSDIFVRAEPYMSRKSGLEDWAFLVADFPDGKKATIEVSWITPGRKKRLISIEGSNASAVVDVLNQKITIYGEQIQDIQVIPNNTIRDELIHFIDRIKSGEISYNSGYVGAKTVELLEKSNQSIPESKSKFSILKDIEVGRNSKVFDQVNLYKCKIGENSKVEPFTYIEENVEIGNNVKIKPNVFIPSGVKIEDDVFIGPGVVFTNDKYPRSLGDWKMFSTTVKKGASIGAGSVILPGVTIGEGAMIGAGSVVTKDVPPATLVVGNPAREFKKMD